MERRGRLLTTQSTNYWTSSSLIVIRGSFKGTVQRARCRNYLMGFVSVNYCYFVANTMCARVWNLGIMRGM